MLELENKVYEMRFESEMNDIIYDCEMYLMESENTSNQSTKTGNDNIKKRGIVNRFLDIIKKFVARVKKILFGEANSAIDNYKKACPVGYNTKADAAAQRLAEFAKKENPTEAEIEQAKKDNDILKQAIETEKKDAENRKKGAKADKIIGGIVLGGTALFNLYYNLYGSTKLLERNNKKCAELMDRLDNGEYVPDHEIEKIKNNVERMNILNNTISYVGSISRKIISIFGAGIAYDKIKQKTGSEIASTVGGLAIGTVGLASSSGQQKRVDFYKDAFDDEVAKHRQIEIIDVNESTFDDLYYQIHTI